MSAPVLYLLDAMALIYRAHFALQKSPRITSGGLNTSAVFGFTTALLDVVKSEKPTHIGVAFDTDQPTFRHTDFEAYKAQRQAQPEDITVAIPYVKRVLEAMKIPVLELHGFEADDIIGTLAKKAAREGVEVYMMTPDKDYNQLVEEHIHVYKPAYMGNPPAKLGVAEVLERWEISHPEQVIDILGLMGDSSDNIPGIPKVGEKTAKKLIQEYGSVENVIANADGIKGALGENIRNHADLGLKSKFLATIKIDCPIDLDLAGLEICPPDADALAAVFDELEFRTLKARLLPEKAGSPTAVATKQKANKGSGPSQMGLFGPPEPEAEAMPGVIAEPTEETHYATIADTSHLYHLIASEAEAIRLAKYLALQPAFCFDTETTGINPLTAELVGISFCYRKGEAYYLPLPTEREACKQALAPFIPILANDSILKIGQNLKYDINMLSTYGIQVSGPLADTMLMHYLINPDAKHGMDRLAAHYLGYQPVSITSLIGKKGKDQGSMRDVELNLVKEYAAEDADITWQLYHIFKPMLEKSGLTSLHDTMEAPLMSVLAAMEQEGICVDTSTLAELSKSLTETANVLEEAVYEAAGEKFNLGSPAQLGKILFDKLKLDPNAKKTKTGQYATNEEVLTKLTDTHPIVNNLLDWREMVKLRSTYVDALPELINPNTGRVHTTYNQTVAATGRLSSQNPNLQNIPIRTARGKEIRKAFVPRDENFVLLSADYSQIELRLMAQLSGDETMLQAFEDGKDIHAITASRLYKVELDAVDSEMRRRAKTANFGIIYGISAFGLSQRLNIPRKEAAAIIDNYWVEFPKVKQYMDRVINEARELGYVTTMLGRRRYLPDINSRNQTMRGFAERNAINAPIQGSAADLIKLAMIKVAQWMTAQNLKSKLLLQVHDELVFDAHKSELDLLKTQVATLMTTAMPLSVPLEVGIGSGQNWLEAH